MYLSLSSWEKGREVTVPMRSIPCGRDGSELLEWWQEEGPGEPEGRAEAERTQRPQHYPGLLSKEPAGKGTNSPSFSNA